MLLGPPDDRLGGPYDVAVVGDENGHPVLARQSLDLEAADGLIAGAFVRASKR